MVLIMLPMWCNLLIRTYALMALLDNGGLLNSFLESIGMQRLPIVGTDFGVILGMIYDFLPYMVLPIFTVMTKLDNRYIEAAHDLGCSNLQTLFRVVVPMTVSGVVSGVTMVFVPSISTFYISQKLGAGKIDLVGDTIERLFQNTSTYGVGATMSLIMMVLIIVSVCIMNRFTGQRGRGHGDMKALSRIYVGLIFFLLYVPILVLIIFSFNEGGSLASFTGVSLKWYRELFADEEALTSLRNSVVLAVSAALIATVIGTFGALGLNTMRKRWLRGAVQTVTNIPMMNPDIVTGVSMMLLFVAAATILGTSNTFGFGTLLIAHVTFDLPYVILSVMPRFKTLDSSLSEAAQDLGCTPSRAFFAVELHEIVPGIVSGLMMSFTLSLDDFVISHFVSSPDFRDLAAVRLQPDGAQRQVQYVCPVCPHRGADSGGAAGCQLCRLLPDRARRRREGGCPRMKHMIGTKTSALRRAVALCMVLICLCGCALPLLTSCKGDFGQVTTLYVYNWGEYISDGSEDSLDSNAAFEEWYYRDLR